MEQMPVFSDLMKLRKHPRTMLLNWEGGGMSNGMIVYVGGVVGDGVCGCMLQKKTFELNYNSLFFQLRATINILFLVSVSSPPKPQCKGK